MEEKDWKISICLEYLPKGEKAEEKIKKRNIFNKQYTEYDISTTSSVRF